MSGKLKLIVLGAMGRIPYAGMAWEALHYVEGFRRLGHDVYYVEDTGEWPYDPVKDTLTDDSSYTVDYIARLMTWCGLSDRWAYRAEEQEGRIYGLSETHFKTLFREADILVNVTAATELQPEHLEVPVRVYLQTDPGEKEIKAAQGDEVTLNLLSSHTHFFSFAENLGSPDCKLPPHGFQYHLTRQPIVLDWFTPAAAPSRNGNHTQLCFTTVANWRQSECDVEWNGEVYTWSKHSEFMKFIDLPSRIRHSIQLALASEDEEARQLLTAKGWKLTAARPLTTYILPYRDFIFQSDGEFTVAKDQNIRLRTGWFSERSASYLTAGKPVITQDTGFGTTLPTGEGLFSFRTMDQIVAAFEAIESNYCRHSRAARALAQEYFRAETVLGKLIEELRWP